MQFPRIPIRTATNLVLAYLFFSFVWWAYHLWTVNDENRSIQLELLNCKFKTEQKGINQTALENTTEYKGIMDYHRRQENMVLGEGIVLSFFLLIGMWIIRRSVNLELTITRQRRNFMLSITHELKSPIASVQLVLETLARRDLEKNTLQKLCNIGVRDTKRLQSLVDDLLLASHLEDNWTPLVEPVLVQQLLADVVSGLKFRYPDANIQVDIPENFAPIQADKSGLTAIFQNLIENAIKYSDEGAPVLVSLSRMDGITRIKVEDQGHGIPDEEKKKVFDKFYRIGNEETRNATGTGLGLYIVREVLRAHGGSIQLSNNTPKGSVFTVEI